MKKPWLFLVALLVGASLAIRLFAARDEFWVDEIISWRFARSPQASVLGILFGIHSDNNHHLNTLWMYAVGDRWDWIWYRLPSIFFGAGAVAVAANLARRTNHAAAVIAAILTGSSFFLIQYSSEARGYAMAMFFSLLAMMFLRRSLDRGRVRDVIIFNVTCVLALLSHLTFLYVYAGFLAWSMTRLIRRERGTAILPILRLHAIPIAFFVLMFATDFSRMAPAGGPKLRLLPVMSDTICFTFGIPPHWSAVAIVIAGVLLLYGLLHVARRSTEWIFHLTAIAIGPTLMVLLTQNPFIYPRYFVLAMSMLLLLIAELLGSWWERSKLHRAAAIGVILGMSLGNAFALKDFFSQGRGHYLEALQFISTHADAATTVGSPRDGRNQPVFEFYRRYLKNPAQLRYVAKAGWETEPPQWLIVDAPDERSLDLSALPFHQYTPAAAFRHSGLSGVDWYVFRRAQ